MRVSGGKKLKDDIMILAKSRKRKRKGQKETGKEERKKERSGKE